MLSCSPPVSHVCDVYSVALFDIWLRQIMPQKDWVRLEQSNYNYQLSQTGTAAKLAS